MKNMSKSYENFKKGLEIYPFIIIIGKYDQILGPRALSSSFPVKNEDFIHNLLRDALNTNNKYVNLDYNEFYAQINKVKIEDLNARGGKQLYAIILLRHSQYPLITSYHFHRIEMLFHNIGDINILKDDDTLFKDFFKKINEIYIKKEEILPIESLNLKIRSGITTIQGFCELILEGKKNNNLPEQTENFYVELILKSCKEMTDALERQWGCEEE